MLGRIMAAVKANGIEDDTLFIFTSDNGAAWRPEDMARYSHLANGEWRGQKADIWEAGHRIPFFARWPGKIKPGTVNNETGSLADLFATLAAILKTPLPRDAAEDSYNLLPLLLGTNYAPVRTSIIDHSNNGNFCITEGGWKLEEVLGSGGFSLPVTVDPASGGPKGQFYHLSVDPDEKHNLYLQYPEKVEHLRQLLERYKTQGYSRPM
jgi:arylsulfatase A